MRKKMIRPGPPPEVEKLYFSESDYRWLPKLPPLKLVRMATLTEWNDPERAPIIAELAWKLGINVVGVGETRSKCGHAVHTDYPHMEYTYVGYPGYDLVLLASEPGSGFRFHLKITINSASDRRFGRLPEWKVSVHPYDLTDANSVKAKELTKVFTKCISKYGWNTIKTPDENDVE